MLNVTMPVWHGARLAKRDKMQLVVVSHCNFGHRLVFSCLYRELASCGYCVISMTHNDGSADFSPVAGKYDTDYGLWDYPFRNKQVKQREQELITIIEMALKEKAFSHLGEDWEDLKFAENVTLFGQSFGGITVLGAAHQSKRIKGVISLDPWFFPHYKETVDLLAD